jgi:hypothetical protein
MAPETVVGGRGLPKHGPLVVGPVVERHGGEHTGGVFRADRGCSVILRTALR